MQLTRTRSCANSSEVHFFWDSEEVDLDVERVSPVVEKRVPPSAIQTPWRRPDAPLLAAESSDSSRLSVKAPQLTEITAVCCLARSWMLV